MDDELNTASGQLKESNITPVQLKKDEKKIRSEEKTQRTASTSPE